MAALVELRHLSYNYATPSGGRRNALQDVSFSVERGSSLAIIGRSGSGKSTLLHLVAGIDLPTSGSVVVDGRTISDLSERERTFFRRDAIGFVFQFFHLLPQLSVWDNVRLPDLIAGNATPESRARARELLATMGLIDRRDDLIGTLSGGEQQRVAICRALLRRPPLVLADEPTGNLDDETGEHVMNEMMSLVRDEGTTLIYVTHSRLLAGRADSSVHLASGAIVP